MILDDFATWTEKIRRKMLRESVCGRGVYDRLPSGVPIGLLESLDFLEVLLSLDIPKDIREKAEHWKTKLCRLAG